MVTDVLLGAVSRAPENDALMLTVGGPVTPDRAQAIEEAIAEGLPGTTVDSVYVSSTMARIRIVSVDSPRAVAGLLELATFSGFELETRRLVGKEVAVALREVPEASSGTDSANVRE